MLVCWKLHQGLFKVYENLFYFYNLVLTKLHRAEAMYYFSTGQFIVSQLAVKFYSTIRGFYFVNLVECSNYCLARQ